MKIFFFLSFFFFFSTLFFLVFNKLKKDVFESEKKKNESQIKVKRLLGEWRPLRN